MLLLVRAPAMATVGAGSTEPVLPSGALGWRHPSNVQRSVRRLRKRIGYPNFVTHVGRKTVATVLAEAGHDTRKIADQLRHSSVRTTELYIEAALGLAHDIVLPPGEISDIALEALRSASRCLVSRSSTRSV